MSVSPIRAILHVISREFSAYLLRVCRATEGQRLRAKILALLPCRQSSFRAITFSADVTKIHFGPKPQQSEWGLCSSVSGGALDVEVGKVRDRIFRLPAIPLGIVKVPTIATPPHTIKYQWPKSAR